MFIQSIALKNIRSYVDATFAFNKGINFISGDNGAGKTTIIESIGLCLFNAKPTLNISEYYLRYGQTKGKISLCIALNGQIYNIVCKITKTGKKRFVYDEEFAELGLHGDEEIDDFFQEQWRTNYSPNALFTNVIGVRQGMFTAPFLENASDRKAKFNEILRVAQYAAAAKKGVALKDYAKDELHALDVQAAGLQTTAQALEDVQAALVQQEAHLTQLLAQSLHAEQALRVAEQTMAQCEAQKQRYARAARNLELACINADNLQKEYRLLLESVRHAREAQAQSAQFAPAHAAYEAAFAQSKQLEESRSKQKSLQTTHDKLFGTKQALQSGLQARIASFAQQEQALRDSEKTVDAALLALHGQIQAALTDQNDAQARQEAAEQARLEAQKQMQAHASNAQNQAKTRDLQTQIATAQAQVKKHESDLRKFAQGKCPYTDCACDTVQGLREQTQTQLQALTPKIKALQAQSTAWQATLDAQAAQLTQIAQQRESDLSATRHTLQTCKQNTAILQNQLANQKKRRDELQAQQTALQADSTVQANMKQQIEQLAQSCESAAIALRQYEGVDEAILRNQSALTQNMDGYRQFLTICAQAAQLPQHLQKAQQIEEQMTPALQAKVQAQAEFHGTATIEPAYEAQCKQTLTHSQNALTTLQTLLDERSKQFAQKQTELEKIQLAKKNLDEICTARAHMQKTAQTIAQLLDILKNAGARIGSVYAEKIGKRASGIYRTLSGQAVCLQWTNDYEIVLQDSFCGANRERVFKQLSGGEQMSAALSVRIALLLQLSNVGLAFFDEPTAALDTSRREALGGVITQALAQFEQAFIVSHDNTFDAITQTMLMLS